MDRTLTSTGIGPEDVVLHRQRHERRGRDTPDSAPCPRSIISESQGNRSTLTASGDCGGRVLRPLEDRGHGNPDHVAPAPHDQLRCRTHLEPGSNATGIAGSELPASAEPSGLRSGIRLPRTPSGGQAITSEIPPSPVPRLSSVVVSRSARVAFLSWSDSGVLQRSSTVIPTRSSVAEPDRRLSKGAAWAMAPRRNVNPQEQDLAPSFAHEPQNAFPFTAGRGPDSVVQHPCRIDASRNLPIHPAQPRRQATGPVKRSDPESVIDRTGATLHRKPENPARST